MMMNGVLFSKISGMLKKLMTGGKISDIICDVLDEQTQQRIATFLHENNEQKKKEFEAEKVMITVVPVPVRDKGIIKLDDNNKVVYQLRIKTVEVSEVSNGLMMKRILTDLSVNDLIKLLE